MYGFMYMPVPAKASCDLCLSNGWSSKNSRTERQLLVEEVQLISPRRWGDNKSVCVGAIALRLVGIW